MKASLKKILLAALSMTAALTVFATNASAEEESACDVVDDVLCTTCGDEACAVVLSTELTEEECFEILTELDALNAELAELEEDAAAEVVAATCDAIAAADAE